MLYWVCRNAANLHAGEYVWKIPFGEYPESVAKGIKNTGSENYGGPLVTSGGFLVIGATNRCTLHQQQYRIELSAPCPAGLQERSKLCRVAHVVLAEPER